MRYLSDGQGVSAVSAADMQHLKVETETLIQFRNKVDALLKELEGSPASTRNISQQTLTAGKLGTGFAEASDLASAYGTVHAKLHELSQALSDQIQAMTLTIDIARRGYQHVEEQQVVALWKIRDDTQTAYQQARQQAGSDSAASGTPAVSTAPSGPPPSAGSSSAGTSKQGM